MSDCFDFATKVLCGSLVIVAVALFGKIAWAVVVFKPIAANASEFRCTASHREGPEDEQHDVCDQYTRKGKRL